MPVFSKYSKKYFKSIFCLLLLGLLILPFSFVESVISKSTQTQKSELENYSHTFKQLEEINKLNQQRSLKSNAIKSPILNEPRKILPVEEFDSYIQAKSSLPKTELPTGSTNFTSPEAILNQAKPSLKNDSKIKTSYLDNLFGVSKALAQANLSSIFLQDFDNGDIELPWTKDEAWKLTCGYGCWGYDDFGNRVDYHIGSTEYLLNFSKGAGLTKNEPVLAMTSGVVVDFKSRCVVISPKFGCNNGWGYYIVLQVSPDRYIAYDHLSQVGVDSIGQEIDRGQEIGRAGLTGYSIGGHVQVGLTAKPHGVNSFPQTLPFPTTKGKDRTTDTAPIPGFDGREGHWFISSNFPGSKEDSDKDGIPDQDDNCPLNPNPGQEDSNNNGVGDACEDLDSDQDGIPDFRDNCPEKANPGQEDTNLNSIGDACESDYLGDKDGDGILDNLDNCPNVSNADQKDQNGDGKGDVCDPLYNKIICPDGQPGDDPLVVFDTCNEDYDKDGIPNKLDNCKITPNADQKDSNSNGVGDACDLNLFKKRKLYNPKGAYFRNKGYKIPTGTAGDPVNTANGNFFKQDVDVVLPGPAKGVLEDIAPELTTPEEGLKLERVYNSVDTSDGIFGKGWSSDLLTSANFYGSEAQPQVGVVVGGGNLDLFDKENKCGEVGSSQNDNTNPECYSFKVASDSTGTIASLKYLPSSKFKASELSWAETCPLPPKISQETTDFLAHYKITQELINSGKLEAVNSTNTIDGKLPDIDDPSAQKPVYPDCFNFLYADKFGNSTVYHWDTMTDTDEKNDWKAGLPIFSKSREGQVVIYEYSDTATYTAKDDSLPELQKAAFSHLKSISNNFGQKLEFTFDDKGRIIEVKDNLGRSWKYTYDFEGNLIEVQKPNVNSETVSIDKYAYTPSGLLNLVTDSTGRNTLNNTYDQDGRVIAQTDAKGQILTIQYKFDGGKFSKETITTERDGTVTKHFYDDLGRLTKETDPKGNSIIYTYKDNSFAKTSETDRLGRTTTYEYDEQDNPVKITLPDGTVTTNTFNKYAQLTSKTQTKGSDAHVTKLEYEDWRLTSMTETDLNNSSPSTTKFNWNIKEFEGIKLEVEVDKADLPAGLKPDDNTDLKDLPKVYTLAQIVDPNGNTTTYNYNDKFWIESVSNPADSSIQGESKTSFEYDAIGRLVARTSPTGGKTQIAYDGQDNVTSTINALGGKAEYIYLANGLIQAKKDEKGSVQVFNYDLNKKLTVAKSCNPYELSNSSLKLNSEVIQNCLNSGSSESVYTSTFEYNSMDRLISSTDPKDYQTKFTLDEVGNRIETINPDQTSTKAEYDANGNITKTIDELGRETKYVYEELNRVSYITRPDGQKKEIAYDGFGNVTSIKDFDGNSLGYSYDARNNLIQTTDKNGNSTKFAYDLNDNQIQTIDAIGYTSTIAFNSFNQPKSIFSPNGLVTNYTYNPAGQVIKTEKVGKQNNVIETNQNKYDNAGNLIQYTNPLGGNIAFEYDPSNQIVAKKEYLGDVNNSNLLATTSFEYDTLGRNVKTIDPQGYAVTSVYSPLSELSRTTDRNGNTTQFEYNNRGSLTKLTNPKGDSSHYTYNDNQTLKCSTTFKPVAKEFVEDGFVPASTSNKGLSDLTYQFDYTKVKDGYNSLNGHETTCMEYDVLDRVIKSTDPLGQETKYSYNLNSQVVEMVNPSNQTTKFSYDLVGNLLSSTDTGGFTTSFKYDKNDRLLSTTNSKNQTTSFVYNQIGKNTQTIYPNPENGANIDTVEILALYPNNVQLSDSRMSELRSQKYSIQTDVYDERGNKIQDIDPNGKVIGMSYNSASLLNVLTDASGNVTSYTYDPLIRKTSIKLPTGVEEFTSYDNRHQIVQTTDRFKAIRKYAYDGNQNLVSEVTPLGNEIKYTLDPNNQIVEIKDVLSQISKNLYDPNGRLISQTNALGNQTNYNYDPLGRLIQTITDDLDETKLGDGYKFGNEVVNKPNQRVSTSVKYNEIGLVVETANELSDKTKYSYNPQNQLIETVLPNGATTKIELDSLGNALSVTDALNHKTSMELDQLNRTTKVTDAKGGTYLTSYDLASNPISNTNPNGNTTKTDYVKLLSYLPATITDPLNYTLQYRYDGLERNIETKDKNNNIYKYSYNDPQRFNTQFLPEQVTKRVDFDAEQNTLVFTDGNGAQYTSSYDIRGRLVNSTNPDGGKIQKAYDNLNQTLSHTAPTGGITKWTFGPRGEMLHQILPDGEQNYVQYDEKLRTTASILPTTKFDTGLSNSTDLNNPNRGTNLAVYTYTYDKADNQLTNSDPFKNTSSYTFDLMNNALTSTNPSQETYQYEYDPLYNLTKVLDPNSAQTTYDYDPNSNLIKVTDANGNPTNFQFTKRDEISLKTDALNRTNQYFYDGNGNEINLIKADGTTRVQEFDGLNRLSKRQYQSGNQNIISPGNFAFNYNQINCLTQAIQVFDGAKSTSNFEYDLMGRMTAQNQIQDGIFKSNTSAKYTYDQNSNLITESLGGESNGVFNIIQNHSINYTKGDKTAVLNSTKVWGGESQVNQVAIDYDQAGQLITRKDQDGKTTDTYSYDIKGRILSSIHPSRGDSTFTPDTTPKYEPYNGYIERVYDPSDRVVSQYNYRNGVEKFGYDKVSRLTSYTSDRTNQALTYDKVGNRLSLSGTVYGGINGNGSSDNSANGNNNPNTNNGSGSTAINSQNTYDKANQLVKAITSQGSFDYKYDLNGNRTQTYQDGLLINQSTFNGEDQTIYNFDYNLVASSKPDQGVGSENVGTETVITYNQYDFLHRNSGNLNLLTTKDIKPDQIIGEVKSYQKMALAGKLNDAQTNQVKQNLVSALNKSLVPTVPQPTTATNNNSTPSASTPISSVNNSQNLDQKLAYLGRLTGSSQVQAQKAPAPTTTQTNNTNKNTAPSTTTPNTTNGNTNTSGSTNTSTNTGNNNGNTNTNGNATNQGGNNNSGGCNNTGSGNNGGTNNNCAPTTPGTGTGSSSGSGSTNTPPTTGNGSGSGSNGNGNPTTPSDPNQSGNNDNCDKNTNNKNCTPTEPAPTTPLDYALISDNPTRIEILVGDQVKLNQDQNQFNDQGNSILNTEILDVLGYAQSNVNTGMYRQFSGDKTIENYAKYNRTPLLSVSYQNQTLNKTNVVTPGSGSNISTSSITPVNTPNLTLPTTVSGNSVNTHINLFSFTPNTCISSICNSNGNVAQASDPMSMGYGNPNRRLFGSTQYTTRFDYINAPSFTQNGNSLGNNQNADPNSLISGLNSAGMSYTYSPRTLTDTNSQISYTNTYNYHTDEINTLHSITQTKDTLTFTNIFGPKDEVINQTSPTVQNITQSSVHEKINPRVVLNQSFDPFGQTTDYNLFPYGLTPGSFTNQGNGNNVGSGNQQNTKNPQPCKTQSANSNNCNNLNPFNYQPSTYSYSGSKDLSKVTYRPDYMGDSGLIYDNGNTAGCQQELASCDQGRPNVTNGSGNNNPNGSNNTPSSSVTTSIPTETKQFKPGDPTQPTLDYGRRNYDPFSGTFTSIDPVVNGYTYNPLSNNSQIGTNHQNQLGINSSYSLFTPSSYQPYHLVQNNPLSGKDWDGYVFCNAGGNIIQGVSCSSLNSNQSTNGLKYPELGHIIDPATGMSLQETYDTVGVDLSGYIEAKPVSKNASSSKSYNSKLSSNINRTNSCKSDTVYPYNDCKGNSSIITNSTKQFIMFVDYDEWGRDQDQQRLYRLKEGHRYKLNKIRQKQNEDQYWLDKFNANNAELGNGWCYNLNYEVLLPYQCHEEKGVTYMEIPIFDEFVARPFANCFLGGDTENNRALNCFESLPPVKGPKAALAGTKSAVKYSDEALELLSKLLKYDDVSDANKIVKSIDKIENLDNLISFCNLNKVTFDSERNKSNSIFGELVANAGIDCSKLVNVVNKYKHYPSKNMSWKEVIKATQGGGNALYKPGINIPQIERKAAEAGIFDGTYVWYKADDIIGASKGTETKYIRIDLSANTYHGHPVTVQEIVNQGGNDILTGNDIIKMLGK